MTQMFSMMDVPDGVSSSDSDSEHGDKQAAPPMALPPHEDDESDLSAPVSPSHVRDERDSSTSSFSTPEKDDRATSTTFSSSVVDGAPVFSTTTSAQSPPPHRMEVVITALPSPEREKYLEVVDNEVELVLSETVAPEGDSLSYKVEFRDGRQETVSFDELLRLKTGPHALSIYQNGVDSEASGRRATKRKRSYVDMFDSETGSDDDQASDEGQHEDEDEILRARTPRRTLRPRQPPPVPVNSLTSWVTRGDTPGERKPFNRLRTRQITSLVPGKPVDPDIDELAGDPPQASSSDDDDDFLIVRSDLTPAPKRQKVKKRSKRLKAKAASSVAYSAHSRGSSIEFERPRRSNRAGRATKSMRDSAAMDLDSFYILDDKAPSVPKTVSIKEVFKTLPSDSSFVSFHMPVCDVCNQKPSPRRGELIYCQGCTLSFHKMCIGIRQHREHVVTKIDDDEFVLQCCFCVGRAKAKDRIAARQSMCQACRKDGTSCAAFSEKKTAKQEEAIRDKNGGVDPITKVAPSLLNNVDNILFRCVSCRRPWHIEHLPTTRLAESDLADVAKEERFKEYSADFKCGECSSMRHKIDALIAWRTTKLAAVDTSIPFYLDITEDDKEYLVKWCDRSYFHCTWVPGAWLVGVASPIMRRVFGKKALEMNLFATDEKQAIPEEYLIPDVILGVKYNRSLPKATSRAEELSRISQISKIYVKFQGLGYDAAVWDSPPSKDSGNIYQAFEAAFYEYINGVYFQPEPYSKVKERVQEFKEKSFKDEIELAVQPSVLKGKLMKYQLQGVNWMLQRYHQGQNAILADEMGLGKTVQVIALISTLVFDSPRCWPFLIVVPNSTCPNWRREIKFWAPDLRVVTYHGGRVPQELSYKYELFPNGSKDMKAHVVVMSYDSAQDERTRGLFKSVHWAGLVVDEGQRLKNDQSLLYNALRAMTFPYRLLLTGTPLQNNKRELFNLLQFVDSNYNAVQLDQKYQVLTAETVRELHGIISPYFYRRTKAGVLKFLPGMAQIIIPVTMTVVQQKLCQSIMAKNPDLIRSIFANSKLATKERGSLNNILMQLRKCLAHPFIYSEAVEDRNAYAETMHRNLVDASGKLLLLEAMLPKLKEQGHRVLIFSQFLSQLDILEDFLTGMNMTHERLDGKMSSLQKQKRIDAFNAPDSNIFAFLLSTRAGGVGINLATADTVIIMDPDFNPHQDMQALSRAHRIGQRNPVLCYQLMNRNSVEEKIMQVGKKKMALDHALIERMDMDDPGEDLEGILRYGAEALFDEKEKEVIRYDEGMVAKLIDREQARKDDEEEESAFTYARVWSAEKGGYEETGLDAMDMPEPTELPPNVWDSILATREAAAEQVRKMKEEALGRGSRRRVTVNYRNNAKAFGLDPADLSDSDREILSDGMESDGYPGDEGTGHGKPARETDANSVAALTDEGTIGSDLTGLRQNGEKKKEEKVRQRQRQGSAQKQDEPRQRLRDRRQEQELQATQQALLESLAKVEKSKVVGNGASSQWRHMNNEPEAATGHRESMFGSFRFGPHFNGFQAVPNGAQPYANPALPNVAFYGPQAHNLALAGWAQPPQGRGVAVLPSEQTYAPHQSHPPPPRPNGVAQQHGAPMFAASKAEIRVALDNLKFSGLPAETVRHQREALKAQLRAMGG